MAGKPRKVSGVSVVVKSAFTLPRKYLSDRLHDIHTELKLGSQEEARTHGLVEKAISNGNRRWALRGGAPEEMIRLAQRWKLENHQYDRAKIDGCRGLREPDLSWCNYIFGLDTKQSQASKIIDFTEFAVLEVNGDRDWKVITTPDEIQIGSATFEVTAIRSKDREDKSNSREFVVLFEKREDETGEDY